MLNLDAMRFARPGSVEEMLRLATGGDDYQTLFTVGPENVVAVTKALKTGPIGQIRADLGLSLKCNGRNINLPETLGFEHS